ncbi:MAG: peptidyl-prolyl cis-trans isomerase [Desulfobacteraceae bacterium]|uniref:Peptidyl-prolyl cis-trans isomerase n=1 Tax=Candidatus Desulfacyla euxinica TaxID=2841693 RepID=A0A8J6MYC7_9DELT|nr:peptidyl-prolyl cis-trans isomerase [Candidatus Desulfacyla euxinica]MBL6977880.1 peptidyl-prolyl cis-trans isomerase [Desulfobacteraceae bacterium]
MKQSKTRASLILFFAGIILLFHSSVSGKITNRVVAIVNDEVVTLYELNTMMQLLTGIPSEQLKSKSEDAYFKARQKVLDDLIDQKIVLEKIKELEITVTAKEVDKAIERVKTDNQFTQEDLVSELKKQGTTYETYKKSIKDELERVQLVNYEVKSKIIIMEEEIEKYYETHREEFTREGRVRLALIFLKQEDPADKKEARDLYQKAQEILLMIKDGKNFANLAEKFSNGPGASEGGDLGVFKMTELNPEMAEIIKDLPAGGVSKPIVRPYGIRIIKVEEKDGGGEKSFDQVRNAIQTILYRKELDKKYSAWIKDLRKKAYIKIVF